MWSSFYYNEYRITKLKFMIMKTVTQNTTLFIEELNQDYDSILFLVTSFCQGKTKLNELLHKYSTEQISKALAYILERITDSYPHRALLESLLKRLTCNSAGEVI